MRCRTTRAAATVGTLVLLAGTAGITAQEAQPTQETQQTPGVGPAAPAAATPSPSGLARWLDPATVPFIPIPEIDTAPGSGTTLGVIPTVLHLNDNGEIARIVAPDIIHSQYFGWGSRMRIFDYPSQDTQWSVVGGAKERVEREFDGQYVTGHTPLEDVSLAVEAIYDRSGIPRFFGLGNESAYSNQSNYLDNQARLDVSLGRKLAPAWQLAFGERLRYVDILPGVLPTLPSTTTEFPNLVGLGSAHELQQTLTLTRDTRDSAVVPQTGARYLVYGGFVSGALASSVSYTFLGAELRHYWPLNDDLTLAWHAGARYMPSAAGAPFWALSSLGGDRSVTDEREPLRSSVTDRYVDNNLFASGAEVRSRVAGFNAFGTQVNLELGPFIDAGKVFASMGTNPVTHLHTAGGITIRGVARPYVVGYVDVGFGEDGAAIFSGINYPF
jgi:Omp85 superfamily domain